MNTNISTFKYVVQNSSSINRGYYINSTVFNRIHSSSLRFPFGHFEDENLELTIYNTNGDTIGWNTSNQTNSFQTIERTYNDIFGIERGYSYNRFNSSFLVLHGDYQYSASISGSVASDQLVISPIDDLNTFNLGNGSYTISYTPIKNIVGNPNTDDRLIIKEISSDRTEIVVIPQFSKNDPDHVVLNDQYYLFSNKGVKVKYIVDAITANIDSPKMSQIYYDLESRNEEIVNEIKYIYSFKDDISVINFSVSLFNIIRDQFENTLFASYENDVRFSTISDYYNRLCSYVIDKELTKIQRTVPDNFKNNYIFYVSFFYNMFYEILALTDIEKNYNSQFYDYLRNYVNFGNGQLIPIIDWEFLDDAKTPFTGSHDSIVIKLFDPLPVKFDVDSLFYISNLISTPSIFDVTVFSPTTITTIPLRGANFNIQIENSGDSTKFYSFDQLVSSGSNINQKLMTYINQNFYDKNVNIDYTLLENFVHFSSEAYRLESYDNKVTSISASQAQIDLIDFYLTASANPYYITEKVQLQNTISNIKSSFDGYENFLYYSPLQLGVPWRDIHGVSASLYDKFNDNSLINNTPKEIIEDSNNEDYKRFLAMIGHHFDLIYAYINNFPTVNFPENNLNKGLAQNMVYHILSSFGWDAIGGMDADDLWIALFGDDPNNSNTNLFDSGSLESISAKDRTRIIWRRILTNISYILKTKGTEECVRAIMSCYGIPKNLFQIREYGGIEYTTDLTPDSLYIYDNNNYFLYFSGSNEYIQTPWWDDARSVEFKVAFDEFKTDSSGDNFRLILNDVNWAIGFVRETGSWARGYFTITDSGSNIQTMVTDIIPVFNGDVFSVLLRKGNINPNFDLDPCATPDETDLIPVQYDLLVKRSEDERMIFEVSSSIILSGSFNKAFRSGSNLYIGNYSIVNPQDNLFGNVDQIRVWGTPLSDQRFNNHVMFTEAYDTDDPASTVENLFLKLDFDFPESLYFISGSVEIPNESYNQTRVTSALAYNFASESQFPYNFTKFETRETVQIPNYGSQKFRSNKVRYETQSLISPLSPGTRSTKKSRDRQPQDSNVLGIFFSPVNQLDTDILRFFGNFQLADLIGDPADLYKKNYSVFEKFREIYFNNGGGELDFQAYINLVKSYFDKSLFSHLKQLVPARSQLITGLLIEPSLLERSKIENKLPTVEIINNFDVNISMPKGYTAEVVQVYTASINPISPTNESRNENFLSFQYGPLDNLGVEVSSDSDGRYTIAVLENNTVVVKHYKAEIIKKKLTYELNNDNGSYTTFMGSFDVVNIIPMGNFFTGSVAAVSLSPGGRLLVGHFPTHHKYKRDLLGRHYQQSSTTTVDSTTGIPDGSLPFENKIVDRTIITVQGQQSATILGTS